MVSPRRFASSRGAGLIELLMALAIGSIVLGLAGAFFAQQSRVSRDTQARNEINIRARAVGEALLQDVRMAGARAVLGSDGRVVFRSALPCDADPADVTSTNTCVTVAGDGGVQRLETMYVSSLFLAGDGTDTSQVCRRITYQLDGTTLYRSDVECSGSGDETSFATEFAADVQRIELQFVCNDASVVSDPQVCFATEDGFIRESQLSVRVGSPRDRDLALLFESATSMLNMRAATRYAEAP